MTIRTIARVAGIAFILYSTSIHIVAGGLARVFGDPAYMVPTSFFEVGMVSGSW